MTLKEEAKSVVLNLFGPINAERVENINDSDSEQFLNQVKEIIAAMLGEAAAQKSLQVLYSKYVKR